ncbi:MAG: hypothetical protein PVG72_09710 [Gammaproteobacteria bacterium]|jgi:hypothetical protein
MAKIVVIPAYAGIQYFTGFLDARVRGHDNVRLLQAILMEWSPLFLDGIELPQRKR